MKPETIFFTGVTGALGPEVLERLLQNGHNITALARPQKGLSAQDRVFALLKPDTPKNALKVVEGDITNKQWCTSKLINDLRGCTMLHAAASVSFDNNRRTEIFETNLGGTNNMLEISQLFSVKEFLYVGTSYAAGNAEKYSEQDVDVGQTHRNPYEASKFEAEKEVRTFAAKNGIPFTVFRPSIIVGDSRTGLTLGWHGYYGFLRAICTIQPHFREEKMQLYCSSKTELNLISVDWVAENMVRLIEQGADDKTYHLVNDRAPKVEWAMHKSLKCLGFSELYDLRLDRDAPKTATFRAQKMLNAGLDTYWEYISTATDFQTSLTGQPAISEEFVRMTLAEAVKARWKTNIKTTPTELVA